MSNDKKRDCVDVIIKPGYKGGSKIVHVINQIKKDGKFDEHKVVMGATHKQEAKNIYNSNYASDWDGAGDIMEMSQEEFRKWVYSTEPRQGELEKESSDRLTLWKNLINGGIFKIAAPNVTDHVPVSTKSALKNWGAPNTQIQPQVQTPAGMGQPGAPAPQTTDVQQNDYRNVQQQFNTVPNMQPQGV